MERARKPRGLGILLVGRQGVKGLCMPTSRLRKKWLHTGVAFVDDLLPVLLPSVVFQAALSGTYHGCRVYDPVERCTRMGRAFRHGPRVIPSIPQPA
jgi:hypothetical protein